MSSALAVLAAASALLLCPGLAQKHAQADKPFSGLAWAQAAEPLDPDIDLCAALKSAIAAVKYDGKEICVLKSCDVTGTRIACDNIAVSLVIPLVTTVTDTFSFNAVLDLCPAAGKDLSIALSFSDTGMSYAGGTPAAPISYEETFSSASKFPVKIPIASILVASIDAEITVGIAKVGDNINAQIGADVCASVPLAGSYCGKTLLPGSLPLVILNQTLPLGDFCKQPPPAPKADAAQNGTCFAKLPLMCMELDDDAYTKRPCTATCGHTYTAVAVVGGVALLLCACCVGQITGRKRKALSLNDDSMA